MKAIHLEPGQPARLVDIQTTSYRHLAQIFPDSFDGIRLGGGCLGIGVIGYVGDTSLLDDSPANPAAKALADACYQAAAGRPYHTDVRGPMVILGITEAGESTSVPDEFVTRFLPELAATNQDLAALKAEAKARAEACAFTEHNSDDDEIARLRAVIRAIADAQDVAALTWTPDRMRTEADARPSTRIIHTVSPSGFGATWTLDSVLAAIDDATEIKWRHAGFWAGHELVIAAPNHFEGRPFLAAVTRQPDTQEPQP